MDRFRTPSPSRRCDSKSSLRTRFKEHKHSSDFRSPSTPLRRNIFYGHDNGSRRTPSSSRRSSQHFYSPSMPSRRRISYISHSTSSDTIPAFNEYCKDIGNVVKLMSTAHMNLVDHRYGQTEDWLAYRRDKRDGALDTIRKILDNIHEDTEMTPSEHFLKEYWCEPSDDGVFYTQWPTPTPVIKVLGSICPSPAINSQLHESGGRIISISPACLTDLYMHLGVN